MNRKESQQLNCDTIIPAGWNIWEWSEKHKKEMAILNSFLDIYLHSLLSFKGIVGRPVLFGSYARGNATSESDIDIAILYDDNIIKTHDDLKTLDENIADLDNKILYEFNYCIRTLFFPLSKDMTTGLFLNIKREGVRL